MFTQRKKQDPFFTALLEISKNVQSGAHYTYDYKVESVSDLKELSVQMKKFETGGDTLVHELIAMLNKSFMTPIEREDILEIAIKMDDILDGLEQFTAYLDMFALTSADEYVETFLDNIRKSTDEIVKAMELLSSKKLPSMREHAVQVKEYERICDEVLRTSIKQLFLRETDPILIIKFKDLYEQLEDIADSCQGVANTIETIIMRNA